MTADVIIQRRIFISGTVQGVGFRASTHRQASQYPEVKGYVKNLTDGRVEAVFQGPSSTVLILVAWCRQGPPSAQVTGLEVIEEAPQENLPPFAVAL